MFYGAATVEAQAMTGKPAVVVGGGNSAGQAALHLSKYAARVTILVRSQSLAATMSQYLIREIESVSRVEIRYGVEVIGCGGDGRLERLELRDRASGEVGLLQAAGLFVLIGAEPFTAWLPEAVSRDEWGFILTGPDIEERSQARAPSLLETSMPGVFAVGDARHGSVKRVASAVGEGSIAVRMVHEYLASSTRPALRGKPGSGSNPSATQPRRDARVMARALPYEVGLAGIGLCPHWRASAWRPRRPSGASSTRSPSC